MNLLEQETESGSGISWAICTSAPRQVANNSNKIINKWLKGNTEQVIQSQYKKLNQKIIIVGNKMGFFDKIDDNNAFKRQNGTFHVCMSGALR